MGIRAKQFEVSGFKHKKFEKLLISAVRYHKKFLKMSSWAILALASLLPKS